MSVRWGGRGPGHLSRWPKATSSGPTPAEQIAAMNPTVWYDPSDLSTVWQDAGSTAGAVDSVVGRIEDKSGNGHHANQATGSFKPILRLSGGLYSMQHDGLDDYLLTSAIDFTATDKVTVFLALRKLSDAATGMAVEMSANVANNAGSFYMAPNATGPVWQFFGRASNNADVKYSAAAAPASAVLTGEIDIAEAIGDEIILRKDGVAGGTTAGDLGTGNFGSYPLYIGRRGGTTLPFNGHFYGLIVLPRIATADEIAVAESYLASKSGVTL